MSACKGELAQKLPDGHGGAACWLRPNRRAADPFACLPFARFAGVAHRPVGDPPRM